MIIVFILVLCILSTSAYCYDTGEISSDGDLLVGIYQNVTIKVSNGKYGGCTVDGIAEPLDYVQKIEFTPLYMLCAVGDGEVIYDVKDWKILDSDGADAVRSTFIEPDWYKEEGYRREVDEFEYIPLINDEQLASLLGSVQKAKYGYYKINGDTIVRVYNATEPTIIRSVTKDLISD